MVKTIILSHGTLAEALLESARRIAGTDQPLQVQAIVLEWNEPFEGIERQLAGALAEVDEGDGVLILTEMVGNTPSNVAMRFHRPGKVEVVGGVNLPMILWLACRDGSLMTVGELAAGIQDKGRRSIARGRLAPDSAPEPGVCR